MTEYGKQQLIQELETRISVEESVTPENEYDYWYKQGYVEALLDLIATLRDE